MQVNIKDRQEVEATVEVIVPANEVDNAFNTVLSDLARQVRIPGFRPEGRSRSGAEDRHRSAQRGSPRDAINERVDKRRRKLS